MAEDFQEFDRLKREVSKVSDIMRVYGATSKEASNAMRQFSNETSSFAKSLKSVGNSAVGLASGLGKGNSSLSSFSNIVKASGKAFGDMLSDFGALGKVVGFAGEAAAQGTAYAIDQYDTALGVFQQLSTIGAVGATGINELAENIKDAGIPMREFAGAISRNNASLTALTGSSYDSARSFAEMINTMNVTTINQQSSLSEQLRFIGFTTDEISDTLVNFSDLQRRLGTLQTLDQKALTDGSVRYGKELDLIAKLTGQSRKESQSALDSAMREGRFLAAQRKISRGAGGKEAAGELKDLVVLANALSPALASAVKDISGGFIGTDAAKKGFLSTGGELTNVMAGIKDGTLNAEQAIAMLQGSVEKTLPAMEAINLAAGDSTGAFMPLHESVNVATFALGDLSAAIEKNKRLQDEQIKADPKSATQSMAKAQRDMQDISASMQATVLSFDKIPELMSDLTEYLKGISDNVAGALGTNRKVAKGALYNETDVAIINSELTLDNILSEIKENNKIIKYASTNPGMSPADITRAKKDNLKLRERESILTQELIDLRNKQKIDPMTVGRLLGNILTDHKNRGGVSQGAGILSGFDKSEAELKDIIKQQGIDINAPLTADQMQRAKEVWNKSNRDISEGDLLKQILDSIRGAGTAGPLQSYNATPLSESEIIKVSDTGSVAEQKAISANSKLQLDATEQTNKKLDQVLDALGSGNDTNKKVLQQVRN